MIIKIYENQKDETPWILKLPEGCPHFKATKTDGEYRIYLDNPEQQEDAIELFLAHGY